MPQLTQQERTEIDNMVRAGETPAEIIDTLQAARRRCGMSGPCSSAVYDFLAGTTHQSLGEEERGRPAEITMPILKVLDKVRQQLITKANNEYRVTWADIASEGKKALVAKGLMRSRDHMWSADCISRHMRGLLDVKSRHAKRRIARTPEDEQKRFEVAQAWRRRRQAFWNGCTYIDNKKFVGACSKAQKRKMRQARITTHLRKPNEGMQPGFVAAKKNRILCGIPSFEVTAAVYKDRIIFWRETPGNWNGNRAAEMYAELGRTLRRVQGNKRKFQVVEDGDRKGFQSGLGKAAKREAKIESILLPPRTPEWMPLDFSLWYEIEKRLYEQKKDSTESLSSFKKRLRNIAMSLPRSLVRSCIASMKKRIELTYVAKGKHIKKD